MTLINAFRALARPWLLGAFTLCLALGSTAVRAQGLGLAGPVPVQVLPANGFPVYYQDTQGLALEQCLVAPSTTTPIPDPCALAGTLPLGNASTVLFPTNFPPEFFFMRAVSRIAGIGGVATNRATLVLALEGAFDGAGTVTPGQQIVFARFRLCVVPGGLVPGATYTVTHPYGVRTFVADAGGAAGLHRRLRGRPPRHRQPAQHQLLPP